MNYPQCREIKHLYLTGKTRIFDCDLIILKDDFGVLRYILKEPAIINNYIIPEKSVTYGFYWLNHPYTLYRWYDERGKSLGDYFNIADEVKISPQQFEWRDLIIDIFIDQKGRVAILDENELPKNLDTKLTNYIRRATGKVLRSHSEILNETNRLAARLF